MPSDPTGVQPRGVLIRPASDWFDDNLAVAGFEMVITAAPDPEMWFRISLFNNGNQGQVFKVYGITIENDGGGGLVFWFNKGPLGTFQQGANAIRPDYGIPFGQVFFDFQGTPLGNTNPYINVPIVGQVGVGGFDSSTNLSPFPLFIIPAGYALVGANPGAFLSGGATFWYQVSNE